MLYSIQFCESIRFFPSFYGQFSSIYYFKNVALNIFIFLVYVVWVCVGCKYKNAIDRSWTYPCLALIDITSFLKKYQFALLLTGYESSSCPMPLPTLAPVSIFYFSHSDGEKVVAYHNPFYLPFIDN